jgi:hypothetical protein
MQICQWRNALIIFHREHAHALRRSSDIVLLREVLILLSEEAPLRSVVIGVMMRISSRASVSEDVQKTLLQEEMVQFLPACNWPHQQRPRTPTNTDTHTTPPTPINTHSHLPTMTSFALLSPSCTIVRVFSFPFFCFLFLSSYLITMHMYMYIVYLYLFIYIFYLLYFLFYFLFTLIFFITYYSILAFF